MSEFTDADLAEAWGIVPFPLPADDPRLNIRGRPVPTAVRVVAEELFQRATTALLAQARSAPVEVPHVEGGIAVQRVAGYLAQAADRAPEAVVILDGTTGPLRNLRVDFPTREKIPGDEGYDPSLLAYIGDTSRPPVLTLSAIPGRTAVGLGEPDELIPVKIVATVTRAFLEDEQALGEFLVRTLKGRRP